MPLPYGPESVAALEERGFLTANGRVQRKLIGEALAARLLERHVVTSTDPDHLAAKAVSLHELTNTVFGINTYELRQLVSGMTTSRPEGLVQKNLPNGWVLCSLRMEKEMTDQTGGAVKTKLACRFITSDVAVLDSYLMDPTITKAERLAESIRQMLDLAVARVPALAPKRDEYLGQLSKRFAAELTSSTGKGAAEPAAA